MSIEINGKIYRNLQEQVEKNKEDIEELQEQEPGVVYTAGSGIDITEKVISVDNTVALKSELFSGDYDDLTDKPDLTVYATKTELNGYIQNNDTNYSAVFRGKGVYVKEEGTYTATSYGDGAIGRSIPNQPGYTYTLPSATGTLALTSDIPSTTNFVTLDGDQTITGTKTFTSALTVNQGSSGLASLTAGRAILYDSLGGYISLVLAASDNSGDGVIHLYNSSSSGFSNTYKLPHTDVTGTNNYTLATTADIPTLSGLTMYNYKITISGLDGGNPETPRSAVYIVSLPYQWDYSSLTPQQILRLVPVWSVVVDTDTTSGSKNIGRFHWQTGAIAIIDWVDGTHTVMDFTGSFNATISAAAPAHW